MRTLVVTHTTVLDSHINSARYGLRMINVKYFHIADILFYARNDRNRDKTLIDCYLTDCHSGVLSNGYSGGAVGNTEEKPVPNEYRLDQTYVDSLPNDLQKQAENDQGAKAPGRKHVVLENTTTGNSRNRQIVVKDHTLNAYIAQTNENNRTLGQYGKDGSTLTKDDVIWRAPYEVTGWCSDITIELPNFADVSHPDGSFDNTQYPPENYMISSDTGPVSYKIGTDKEGLIQEGSDGDRYQKIRLDPKTESTTW